LRQALSKLHTLSAREINEADGQPGRKVWFQYFDSHITYTNSYLPRLKYVHHNPVHHGVVACAEHYPWCSASWFTRTAKPAFRATVESFKTDALRVVDNFAPTTVPASTEESGVEPPHSK
jgi:putative transposase